MEVLPSNETITLKLSLPPAKSPLIGKSNTPEKKCDSRSKFPASPRFQCRDSSPHISKRAMRTTATSHYSLRKVHGSANKEIIKRALTPPARRPTLRWLDFKPTPSRLCNMSAA
ncbi:hypothetical protein FXO38_32471 [Capsicum annuum]|uniref:uncharacterized protein LOC107863790 n=1 Tax=Capsicum annuum TaxID=4072 RepID=UPI0007BFD7B4|nr:uncharacterized protein LOC107863790 [Capsicum annuum]KAF3620247.1 hypothetical protein FXO38_32471 [Capsicum annuum]KAF3654630.1 hypothetical protein FXO37_16379 [Capsicum annuum]